MASEKPAAKKAVHPMVHTVAGGLAGGIELALMYPTEYGLCQTLLDTPRHNGLKQLFAQ